MIIRSLLDTDLYKLTMQQAVCQMFPRAKVQYSFINRGKTEFPADFIYEFKKELDKMESIFLTDDEYTFLKSIKFFNPVYLDFLRGYRFDRNEVLLSQFNGDFNIAITGPWYRTILWEVPLMAMVSELYFEMKGHDEVKILEACEMSERKGLLFKESDIRVADFGTRRRYSLAHHYDVLNDIKSSAKESFVGTSNIYLSMMLNMVPKGTQAHEWTQFHAAKYGFGSANRMALENWVRVYQGDLGIALTDTFTTKDFFRVFDKKYAKLFDGVRHDSGDPIKFMYQTVDHYKKLGIDPSTKTIIFSDGLNPEKAVEIAHHCRANGIKCSFGIGTNLTNDIEGVKPLNMVIKMTKADPCGDGAWVPTVKLSDDEGKHTGDERMIEACKVVLGV